VCLGSGAKEANKAAMRNYEHQLAQRERSWMQEISLTGVQRIQYEQGIDASNLGLANVFADIQEKHGQLVGQMFTQSQEDWKTFLSESKGAEMKAAGRTGRSTDRISAIELGEYFKKGSDMVNKLTDATGDLYKASGQAAGQARSQQMDMFAQNAFIKNPDLAPPKPVLKNESYAAFMDALSIGSSIVGMGSGAEGWKEFFKQG